MTNENIEKAIEIGICYVKQWKDKIRCFDYRMGYGHFVDLTPYEYEIYLQISTLLKEEMKKRLIEHE